MLSGCTIAAFCLATAAGFAPDPRWTRWLCIALAIDVLAVIAVFLIVRPA